jgi:putative transposase
MKHVLGFWEGATDNSTICEELLEDLERRGLQLHDRIIYITDGGKGVIKALKNRYGKALIQQRCVVHKLRNIVNHLPRHCRNEAKRRFKITLDMVNFEDAQNELKLMERWLKSINLSAAQSFQEGYDEILTLHTLGIPFSLRQSFRSTNNIEGMFSQVRKGENNIRRYRSSAMSQRWLGSVLLQCEKWFRKIKGNDSIKKAVSIISKWHISVAIDKRAA